MGQVFVKASRRAKAHTRKSRTARAAGLSARYNAAIKALNNLPGPSTGIYGTGKTSLDRQYRRASTAARRIGRVMQNNGLIASTGKPSNYLPGTQRGTMRHHVKTGGLIKMTKKALARGRRIQRAVRVGR